MAGTDHGAVMQLETGQVDVDDIHGLPQGIGWTFTTREWSTPIDLILENLQGEILGTSTWIADVDNTNTYTLAINTNLEKSWERASLAGTLGDNINFLFNGTKSGDDQAVYEIEWDAIPERPKVTYFATDPTVVPSENYVKTWLADINPLTGTTTGSLLVDGTVVQTSTFISLSTSGDVVRRQVFETGLPNVTAGKTVNCIYHGDPFRYYDTAYEFEPKPFTKTTWLVTYKKAGGVTQADMARFYAMDIEGLATHVLTNTWIIDGSVFTINTLTFGATDAGEEIGIVRNYLDQIPFPPGARGYLFQQQVTSPIAFKVWRASLDIDRIGIKGLSRVTLNGSPSPGSGA